MKPFNLEEALAGKPVVMRNGDKIKAVYLIKEFVKQPLLVIPDYEDEGDPSQFMGEDGSFNLSGKESEWDLFMYEEPKTYYTNIYYSSTGKPYTGAQLFVSQEEAEEGIIKNSDYFKTIEITLS